MADEKKKSKIDLKARLGRSTMGAGAGQAVPLPVPGSQPGSGAPVGGSPVPGAAPSHPSGRPSVPGSRPSVPAGIAPPPGLSPGIPLPPFAQRPAPQAAPKPTGAAQTIKVEVSEEIEAERKKSSKKMALYATLTLFLGIGIGFASGGAKERSDRGKGAIVGAAALAREVKAANEKMKELRDKVAEAGKQYDEKKFPEALMNDLGAINIPFDTLSLENKRVGDLTAKTLRQVLSFTTAVQDVNKAKDALKGALTAQRATVEKAWKEQKEPVVSFSVVFRRAGDKMLAEFAPNKEPFLFGKDWPDKFKVTRLEQVQNAMKPVEKEAVRWVKGDLTGNDLIGIPVDPRTVAGFTSERVVIEVQSLLFKVFQILDGNKDPVNETPGLVKEGDDLANELHKISLIK